MSKQGPKGVGSGGKGGVSGRGGEWGKMAANKRGRNKAETENRAEDKARPAAGAPRSALSIPGKAKTPWRREKERKWGGGKAVEWKSGR